MVDVRVDTESQGRAESQEEEGHVRAKRVGNARKLIFGTGLAVATIGASAAAAVIVPATALADTTQTCYTGCVTPQDANDGGVVAPATSPSDAGLPFTGADIEQLAAIGGGAILAGALLVRRRRRANGVAAVSATSGPVVGDTTVGSQWRPDSPSTRG
jgi:LPXTG-motif cell wall-anchored protein